MSPSIVDRARDMAYEDSPAEMPPSAVEDRVWFAAAVLHDIWLLPGQREDA